MTDGLIPVNFVIGKSPAFKSIIEQRLGADSLTEVHVPDQVNGLVQCDVGVLNQLDIGAEVSVHNVRVVKLKVGTHSCRQKLGSV